MRREILFALVAAFILFLSLASYAIPFIIFANSTFTNNTLTRNTTIQINVSITEPNLASVIYNWNGTNFTIYNSSLVFMLNLDNISSIGENATKAVDISRFGNNCTINSSIWNSSGRYSGAYVFNGTNTYMDCAIPASLQIRDNITLSAWVKTNFSSQRDFIANQWNFQDSGILVGLMNGSTIHTAISNGSIYNSNDVYYPISDNNWHFISVIFSSGNLKTYADGNLINNVNLSSVSYIGYNGVNRFLIGKDSGTGGTEFWNGTIDEVRVWNMSLSDSDISQLYMSNLHKFNRTLWYLYVNQSQNTTATLGEGIYTYQTFATNSSGNMNLSEIRMFSIDLTSPQISFTSPTPINDYNTTNLTVEINVSITEPNLASVIYNWNGTNFTIYNNSLILMMNFENLTSLRENASEIKDLSLYGNNGTLYGTIINSSYGKYGLGAGFNGVNNNITVPDSNYLDLTSAGTIAFWAKRTNYKSYQMYVTKGIASASTGYQVEDQGTSGRIAFRWGSDNDNLVSATNISNNVWTFITTSYNGTYLKIYINGMLDNSTAYSTNAVANTDPLRIGARSDGWYFNGSIDELKIWNRSLSDREIYQLYASNFQKYNSTQWYLYVNQSQNSTALLNYGNYTYQVFASDLLNNSNSSEIMRLDIQAITNPQIRIDWIYPTGNINVTQNEWFNITVNVTCLITNCSDFNVTLDPTINTYYNFTSCGKTGQFYPNQSLCDTNYSGTSLAGLVRVSANGTQNWSVPYSGYYRIEAVGAVGGIASSYASNPGRGASMVGTFYLNQGQTLKILVGQAGVAGTTWGGGGGGSFVTDNSNTPLIIAGGGGGAASSYDFRANNSDANISLGGRPGYGGGSGGINGLGGGANSNGASGGGGFYGNGTDGYSSSTPGLSFLSFATGGAVCGASTAGAGGFGGGGGGEYCYYGSSGGGGGYSGGGGGYSSSGYGAGGGGGSINNGTNQNNSVAYNSGIGYVKIQFLGGIKSGTVSMNSSIVGFYTNITNPYNLSLGINESQIIIWTVNATGSPNTANQFFVYLNLTSNYSVSNQTSVWNITIKDLASPIVNITFPLNLTYNYNINSLNYSYSDYSGDGSCWYSNNSGIWNSTPVAAGTNFTNITTIADSNTFTVYCNDSSNNVNSSIITFSKRIPSISLNVITPTTSVNVTQSLFFNVTLNVTCLNGDCGNVNISLDPTPTYKYALVGHACAYPTEPTLKTIEAQYTDVAWIDYAEDTSAQPGDYSNCSAWFAYLNANNYNGVWAGDAWENSYGQGCDMTACVNDGSLQNWIKAGHAFVGTFGAMDYPDNGPSDNKLGDVVGINNTYDGSSAGFVSPIYVITQHQMLNNSPVGTNISASYGSTWDLTNAKVTTGTIIARMTNANGNPEVVYRDAGNYRTVMVGNYIEYSTTTALMYKIVHDIAVWAASPVAGKGGLINTTQGATPFWTNTTNPYNLSMNEGDSEILTFWVNASSTSANNPYEFFAYANLSINSSIQNITARWNVTIKDIIPPLVNITFPLNTSYNYNVSTINYSYSDYSGSGYCWYSNNSGIWNSSASSSSSTGSFSNVKTYDGSNTFTVYCNDSSGNLNISESVTFMRDFVYPNFSAYGGNNGTKNGTAIAIFNVTITNTNGTVFLEINGSNYTANNISRNVWNYSLELTNSTYTFKWITYGNGSLNNLNVSNSISYTLLGNLRIINLTVMNQSNVTAGTVSQGRNFTISVVIESAVYVFIKIWRTVVDGAVLFQGVLSNFIGNVWNITLVTNSSWPVGQVNYTIYANDSLRYQQNISGSVNLTDTIVPEIYLKSPANGTFTKNNTINFVANFSENVGLVNSTLYIWNSSNSLVNISENYILGLYNISNISVTLGYEDSYLWNYYVCDNSSNCGFNNTNYTLIYDSTAPVVGITYPENTTYNVNIRAMNYTFSDRNINGTCWYSNNSGIWNYSNVTARQNFTSVNSIEGTNTWTVYCNDSAGNLNSNSITFTKDTPQLIVTKTFPITSINASYNEWFTVSVNVTCLNANCGNVNVSLDPTSYPNYTFTTCGRTGRTGPNQSHCDTNYSGLSLAGLVSASEGYQNFTIPSTGSYVISARGARGGTQPQYGWNGNGGANITGTFYFNAGDKLIIVVGHQGQTACSDCDGGGGGASYVVLVNSSSSYSILGKVNVSPLIIAGGGGGDSADAAGSPGSATVNSTGNTVNNGSGVGGRAGNGGGGGGFTTNGITQNGGVGGFAFLNGSYGGDSTYDGGFGGGAGGNDEYGAGGGGWNGGNGDDVGVASATSGGGGSFNTGTNQTNLAGNNTGIGLVTITQISGALKGGVVSMANGTTPFYTSSINPYNLSMNEGDSEIISWSVNATGTRDVTYEFFIYANLTADSSIGNLSLYWNVTISNNTVDTASPTISLISPTNGTGSTNINQALYANFSDLGGLSNYTLFIWNSTNSIINQTSNSISGFYNISNISVTLPYENMFKWNYQSCDNSSNCGFGTNYTVYYDITPPYFTSISNKTAYHNETWNLTMTGVDNVRLESYAINWTGNFTINRTSGVIKNITGLRIASYLINVSINDSAGNTNSTIILITILNATDSSYPGFTNYNSTTNNTEYCPNANYIFNVTITSTNGTSGIEFNRTNYTLSNISSYFNTTISNLGGGTYMYYYWSYGNGTRTYFNRTLDMYYTIARNSSVETYLYLNYSRANYTTEVNTYVNLNATVFNGNGIINLYKNGSLINSGINSIANNSLFNLSAIYNITSIFPGNSNYSSAYETWWVNVTPLPAGSLIDLKWIYPTTGINVSQNSFFNITANLTCLGANCQNINTTLYYDTGCSGTPSYYVPSGTANCSSYKSSTYTCSKSNDNSVSTTWFSSTQSTPEYIYWDLTVSKCISGIKVFPFSTYDNQIVDVDVSEDKINWNRVLSSWKIASGGSWNENLTFNEITGRYIRLNFTNTPSYASVTEVQVKMRNHSVGSISNTLKATPFYSNISNPYNISLNVNETHFIIWNINASGDAELDYQLYMYSNLTNNASITNRSSMINITIKDRTAPWVNITNPANTTYSSGISSLNYFYYDQNGGSNCWYSNNSGVWNSSLVIAGTNFTITTNLGTNTFFVYCNDSYGNRGSNNVTFFISIPSVNINAVYPTSDINVNQNQFFNVTVNVSCLNANCGDINVSLDPDLAGCTGTANYERPTAGEYCSSYYSSSYTCQKSHDGSTGTGWFSSSSSGNIIYWDLNSSKCLSGIKIYPWSGYGGGIAHIDVSTDLITWTRIATSWTMPSGGAYNENINFNETLARYVRLNFTSVPYYASVVEVQMKTRNQSKGLISIVPGTSPFWTNISNPFNITLNVNETQLVTWWVNATGSVNNTYVFYSYATKLSNANITNSTPTWRVTILNSTPIDNTYPLFYNYSDNNGQQTGIGIGRFNVTVYNTNGTVILEINNTNITASNISRIFNASYNFISNQSYNYRWWAYGNGTDKNLNNSGIRNYNVSSGDTTPPRITIISPLNITYKNSTILFNITINENSSWCGLSLDGASNQTIGSITTTSSVKLIYNSTGNVQNFTVPAGVTSIDIKVWGAGGGGGYLLTPYSGGAGGFANGTLNVTPGQVLYIVVGGGGGGAWNSTSSTYRLNSGGYGGGGSSCSSTYPHGGGAGGGYSGIFNASVNRTNAIIIAGGGGGGRSYSGTKSGGGGGLVGGGGDAGGGTQSAGGTGGVSGSALQGANASSCSGSDGADGAGGGGGYYGGGGYPTSDGGDAGGGSGYLSSFIMDGVLIQGRNSTQINSVGPVYNDSDYTNFAGYSGAASNVSSISASDGKNGSIVITYTTTSGTTGDSTNLNITLTSVSEGSHSVIFSCNDTAGNLNFSQRTFTTDTLAPSLIFISPTNISYNTKTITINLFNNSDAKNIWFNRGLGNETYSSSTSKTFSEGTNTIYGYANDSVGNLNSTSVTFAIDSTPPGITVNSPLEQTYTTSNIRFNITSDENSYCYFVLNSTDNYTLEGDNRNFNFSLVLVDNTYTITYYCNDSLNNLATAIKTFGVKTTPPQISLNYPASNMYYRNSSVQFNYTPMASDGINTCELWGNWTGEWQKNDSTTSITNYSNNYFIKTMDDGTYIWNIWCNNTNGFTSWSSQGNVSFSIDQIPPYVAFVTPRNVSYNSSIISVEITNNSHAKNIWWYNSSKNLTYYSTADLVLTDGNYSFIAYANDSAGNVNSSSVNFYVDTSKPNFTSYWTNNATLIGNGTGLFNISIIGNGSVFLYINGESIVASNLSGNIFNASYYFTTNNTYEYYWIAYSNGTSRLIDNSEHRYYYINDSDVFSPSAQLLTPENNSYTNSSANFTANITDVTSTIGDTESGLANATLNIVNSSEQIVNQTTVSYNQGTLTSTVGVVVSLVDGVYKWFYNIIDRAGNFFNSGNRTIIKDTMQPNLKINYPHNNSYFSNNLVEINFSVSDSYLESCWYDDQSYSANNSINNCLNISDVIWADGEHNLTLYANDSSGNMNKTALRFSVDSVYPQVILNIPEDGYSNNNSYYTNVNLSCNATDNFELSAISLYITNSINQSLTLNQSSAVESASNVSTWTLNLKKGNYSWTCKASDVVLNSEFADTPRSIKLEFLDIDDDTFGDGSDNLVGSEANVNKTGFSNLNITVSGNSTYGSYNDTQAIEIFDSSKKIMNFTHNFSLSLFDLRNMTIVKNSTYLIVNLSGQLQSGRYKSLYLDDNNFTTLCVKDAEIYNISDMSENCTDLDETNFTDCIGNSVGVSRNTFFCVDNGSVTRVDNLRYSAIRGTQAISNSNNTGNDTGGTSGGSSGGGSSVVVIENKTKAECLKDSDCGGLNYCSDNKCYKGECRDNSQCSNGTSCFNHNCFKLFDIKIIEIQSPVTSGNFLEFSYFLKAMANISNDVQVDFWLEKDNEIKSSGGDTIFMGDRNEKIEKAKIFVPNNLEPGIYNFYVSVLYENYFAESYRQIEIDSNGNVFFVAPRNIYFYILPILIIIIILLSIIVIRLQRKKIKDSLDYEARWILTHKLFLGILYFSLGCLGLIIILTAYKVIKLPSFADYLFEAGNFFRYLILPYIILIIGITLGIIIFSLILNYKRKRFYNKEYGEGFLPKRTNYLEKGLRKIKQKLREIKERRELRKRWEERHKYDKQIREWKEKGYDVDVIEKNSANKQIQEWRKKGYDTDIIERGKSQKQQIEEWKNKGYDVDSLRG